jgi:hypothetical protein
LPFKKLADADIENLQYQTPVSLWNLFCNPQMLFNFFFGFVDGKKVMLKEI